MQKNPFFIGRSSLKKLALEGGFFEIKKPPRSDISGQSTNHQSTNHQSPIHQSPITNHQSTNPPIN